VVLEAEENRESRPDYERVVAYESLTVRLEAR
jgi:hypothetical protein